LAQLHHIALGAAEPARLAEFYRQVLGLRELRRWEAESGELRSVWLDLGGAILMIERTSDVRERVDGIGRGLFLLALTMRADEREHARVALHRRGVEIESETAYTLYFRDPDDNRVALSSYPLKD
jgi:catechol 2,3-dioxygenase-like lactoylglutathione lyase family enzyme